MDDVSNSSLNSHAQIEVNYEKSEKKRSHMVRQDRYEVGEIDCKIVLDDQPYEILDYSTFGIAIFTKDSAPVKNEYSEVPFIIEGVEVSRLHLTKVRMEESTSGTKIAFELIGEPLNLVKISSILSAKQIVKEHTERLEFVSSIPSAISKKVYDLKDSLEHLQDMVEVLRKDSKYENSGDISTFESTIAEVISSHLRDVFDPAYDEFSVILKAVSEKERKASFEFFRVKLRHLIHQSKLAERFYNKPLGYAGDFDMMNFIYRNEEFGDTLFAKCLHRYFMEHSFGKAVRNRATYLSNKLIQTMQSATAVSPKRVLSVACGPAYEIQSLIKKGIDLASIEIHLLDQDLNALRDAQKNIRAASRVAGINPNVKYMHKAIRNIFRDSKEESYDLIYSAGLFDYFSDPVATAAANRLFEIVKPGGQLIIGNFTAADHSKMMMELAFDWHLIYRTEKDLLSLYQDLAPSVRIESEQEGVNLFIILERP